MDGWIVKLTGILMDGMMGCVGWKDGMYGWTDGWMDGWRIRCINGWMDGSMDG